MLKIDRCSLITGAGCCLYNIGRVKKMLLKDDGEGVDLVGVHGLIPNRRDARKIGDKMELVVLVLFIIVNAIVVGGGGVVAR